MLSLKTVRSAWADQRQRTETARRIAGNHPIWQTIGEFAVEKAKLAEIEKLLVEAEKGADSFRNELIGIRGELVNPAAVQAIDWAIEAWDKAAGK